MALLNISMIPKLITYRLARLGLLKSPMPVTLTFSITTACQSLCKTCHIGEVFQKNPAIAKDDLTIGEIEQMFKNIGPVFFFNISGGEPYLRKEIVEIVKLACKHLTPKVIHIPTNALMPAHIAAKTEEMLVWMSANGYGSIPLTIKPSFDGVGKQHDIIRGVEGNFEKLMETYKLLKGLSNKYKNLQVGLGTVISNFNVNDIKPIADFAHTLDPETYINEVAEQRTEMFNTSDTITPDADAYAGAISYFAKKTRELMSGKKGLARLIYAFRLVYYNLVIDILRQKTQVIPCYAGISNVHINAKGQVWPCCVLGYDKPLGNMRENGFDFKKIWHSSRAQAVRTSIKNKECHCPLANQSYSNLLLHTPSLLKVLKNAFFQ